MFTFEIIPLRSAPASASSSAVSNGKDPSTDSSSVTETTYLIQWPEPVLPSYPCQVYIEQLSSSYDHIDATDLPEPQPVPGKARLCQYICGTAPFDDSFASSYLPLGAQIRIDPFTETGAAVSRDIIDCQTIESTKDNGRILSASPHRSESAYLTPFCQPPAVELDTASSYRVLSVKVEAGKETTNVTKYNRNKVYGRSTSISSSTKMRPATSRVLGYVVVRVQKYQRTKSWTVSSTIYPRTKVCNHKVVSQKQEGLQMSALMKALGELDM
jgi:hypothetical protein